MAKKMRLGSSIMALAGLLSGLVCYRLGSFAGCSSDSTRRPAPIRDEHGGAIAADRRSQQVAASSESTSDLKIDGEDEKASSLSSLPYKCGVVFFYHIPSTGGASINTWLKKYANPKKGYGYRYFQHWEADFKGKKSKDIPEVVRRAEAKFVGGMNEHVRGLDAGEWRLAHAHINSLRLNESEHLLDEWRSAVEGQGCHMINTVMLRDPLSHTLSLHKVIGRKNSTVDEWIEFLERPTGRGLWATNLDFVLYNKGERNPHNATREEKVRRAMELLQRHFNVVTVGNHDSFMAQVLGMTGWERIEMPHTNTFKGELMFTKRQVENLQKLLTANGDIEFMDAVRRRYHGYLSHLDDEA